MNVSITVNSGMARFTVVHKTAFCKNLYKRGREHDYDIDECKTVRLVSLFFFILTGFPFHWPVFPCFRTTTTTNHHHRCHQGIQREQCWIDVVSVSLFDDNTSHQKSSEEGEFLELADIFRSHDMMIMMFCNAKL